MTNAERLLQPNVVKTIAEEIQRLKQRIVELETVQQDYVTIKKSAGDPTGREGLRVINTVDNTYKIYADGAWRTIASW